MVATYAGESWCKNECVVMVGHLWENNMLLGIDPESLAPTIGRQITDPSHFPKLLPKPNLNHA